MTPTDPSRWTDQPTHRAWLRTGITSLVSFYRPTIDVAGGFTYPDADGRPSGDEPPALFLTARMAHAAAIGVAHGVPGAGVLLDHAVDSLLGPFRDAQHGGWLARRGVTGSRKEAYDHVHVGLGAASALAVGHPRAAGLLEAVVEVVEDRLWQPEQEGLGESWAADWSDPEPYRGANAAMHGTEAFLALGDATGDATWHLRALAMAARVVDGAARQRGWLIPEHFDAQWRELPDYNRDDPNHPFRPYGATLGHSLEWARFLCALDASPQLTREAWLVEAAAALAQKALGYWGADGRDGLVYTVDWDGRPVSTVRLHWPVCEGIQACAALLDATGDPVWEQWYRLLWDHAAVRFVEPRGTWVNECDEDWKPAGTVWPGRPDVYHSIGAYAAPLVGRTPFVTMASLRAR